MKTMNRTEVEKDWSGLQKQHRMEIAQRVARYCIGNSIHQVAAWLGYSEPWVTAQLDFAGVAAAIGGPSALAPLTGSTSNVSKEVPKVLKEFAAEVKVNIDDDGAGNQTVSSVEGHDAEEFEPYLDHYLNEGHEPAAATRLAKAEWAAEGAKDAGVIQESTNKRNEKVNQILFPEDKKSTFELDLKHHMARVKAAARFLDESKVNYLRRKSTCEEVATADEAWREQVARMLNFHPNLQGD